MSWQAGDSDAMCDCRPGRVTGPQAQMRRAPGGRALCQEDLESFGLSVEITGDFGPPSQSGPAPQFPLKSPAVPQFGPGLQFSSPSLPPEAVPSPKPALKSPGPMFSPNIRQFVSVSLPQQPEPPQPQHQHEQDHHHLDSGQPIRDQYSELSTNNSSVFTIYRNNVGAPVPRLWVGCHQLLHKTCIKYFTKSLLKIFGVMKKWHIIIVC